jgi:YgiT-type zinc finger domain-containing protein
MIWIYIIGGVVLLLIGYLFSRTRRCKICGSEMTVFTNINMISDENKNYKIENGDAWVCGKCGAKDAIPQSDDTNSANHD